MCCCLVQRRLQGGIHTGGVAEKGLNLFPVLNWRWSISLGNICIGGPGSNAISLWEGSVRSISAKWCLSLKIVYNTFCTDLGTGAVGGRGMASLEGV